MGWLTNTNLKHENKAAVCMSDLCKKAGKFLNAEECYQQYQALNLETQVYKATFLRIHRSMEAYLRKQLDATKKP